MESNRVSNKGSITSLMQDPRQTLEHMFSDLVSKIPGHRSSIQICVTISRECVNMLPRRMDTSLWHANNILHGHDKKVRVHTQSFHVQRDAVKDGDQCPVQ